MKNRQFGNELCRFEDEANNTINKADQNQNDNGINGISGFAGFKAAVKHDNQRDYEQGDRPGNQTGNLIRHSPMTAPQAK